MLGHQQVNVLSKGLPTPNSVEFGLDLTKLRGKRRFFGPMPGLAQERGSRFVERVNGRIEATILNMLMSEPLNSSRQIHYRPETART